MRALHSPSTVSGSMTEIKDKLDVHSPTKYDGGQKGGREGGRERGSSVPSEFGQKWRETRGPGKEPQCRGKGTYLLQGA